MPDIIIVAGPNGAGKTSFGNRLRRLQRKRFLYINADEIEAELKTDIDRSGSRHLMAAREALLRLEQAIANRENVMVETTLAVVAYARKIPAWKQLGYRVALVFIRLPSSDHAVDRVQRRVALGGHHIPETTIRRRFELGLNYLDTLYKPIVDEWYVWDSIEGDFVPAEAWDLQ